MDGKYERLVAEFYQSSVVLTPDERTHMREQLEGSVRQCSEWGLYKSGCTPDLSIPLTAPNPKLVVLRDEVGTAFTKALCEGVYEGIEGLRGVTAVTMDGDVIPLKEYIKRLDDMVIPSIPIVESWLSGSVVGVKLSVMDDETPLWVAYFKLEVSADVSVLGASHVTCVHL